jgi:hypothetical protein
MGTIRSDYRYHLTYQKDRDCFTGHVTFYRSNENTMSTNDDYDITEDIQIKSCDLFDELSHKNLTSLIINDIPLIQQKHYQIRSIRS